MREAEQDYPSIPLVISHPKPRLNRGRRDVPELPGDLRNIREVDCIISEAENGTDLLFVKHDE
jgi:hypothetical protein